MVDTKTEQKLLRFVEHLDAINERRQREGNDRDVFDDLGKLLDHSGAVDEVMMTVRSFSVVGRILHKSLIWLVSTVGVTIAAISFFKGGLGWLVDWVQPK